MNPSRRHASASISAAIAGLASAQEATKPQTIAGNNRTSLHYEIEFKASPQRIYTAILDEKQFAAFSGLPAKIDPAPGGKFSMFGGQIEGRNVELIPNQRIVQAWRPTHWDQGVYSIVHFEFKPRGDGTLLIFDHTGFPAEEYHSLDAGWTSHYWDPLKKFLA